MLRDTIETAYIYFYSNIQKSKKKKSNKRIRLESRESIPKRFATWIVHINSSIIDKSSIHEGIWISINNSNELVLFYYDITKLKLLLF